MTKRELVAEIMKLGRFTTSEIIALSSRPEASLKVLLEMLKK